MPRQSLFFAGLMLLLSSAAFSQVTDQMCTALTALSASALPNQTTVITSAVSKSVSAAVGNPGGRGSVPALPAHCEIKGKMNDRTGANGQHYAINFHMRLPVMWNNKFFFEGGGGSNGNIGDALGNLQGQQPTVALALGYAVVSQDSGHDNAVNNDPKLNGTQTFGFDEQARLDFGYNSYDQVAQAAKAIIKAHYGKAPERSYYVGCSEGGREAMMMSQRFPDYFDGILACSPGFKLPKAAIAEAWDTQALAAVPKAAGVNDPNGVPFVNKGFTDDDLTLVARAVLAACDKLDGLEDGIVANFSGCKATLVKKQLATITCPAAKQSGCLTALQIAALEKVFDGPKNSQGQPLYSDWAWDTGIGNPGWRVWKLGMFNAPANSSINATLGSGAISAIFTTPPTPEPSSGAAPVEYLLNFNFDKDASKIFAETAGFAKASWEFMRADSTDLSAFHKHGGKLLVTHGVSDPVFSINDTIAWWNEVNKKNKGKAADFVRFFAVPGMTHCGGGPSTDRYDAFDALVTWVEKKTAPDSILATAGAATPWPNRTRPLCAYPAYPHYKGSGSTEDAASFFCK
jgi:pimeloyl-ACP methyl ester carboxylesterase